MQQVLFGMLVGPFIQLLYPLELMNLSGCRKILRYEIMPIVVKEIANSSAREDLTQFELHVRHTLDHSIKILYHIFRDSKVRSLLRLRTAGF
jgi:hypothetical protein